MQIINEKTALPISFAIVLIGAAAWLTNLAVKVDAGAESMKKVELKQNLIDDIKIDLEVVKSKLDRIEKKLDDRR